jgi:hypothetical protein
MFGIHRTPSLPVLTRPVGVTGHFAELLSAGDR